MKKSSTIFLAAMMMAAAAQAQAANINLQVYDSYGNPLQGVSTQLVTTQFTNVGSTDAAGYLKINVPSNTSYKLKLTYNGTTIQSAAYKTVTGQSFDTFETGKLTIQAKSGATPVSGIGLQLLDATNSWKQIGSTDAAGQKELQVFAKDSMKVRAVASGSMEDRYATPFTYGNDASVCFCNLVKVQVPSTYILVGSSWVGANTYLFPNKYLVRVLGSYSDSLDITGNLVNKVPCVIIVKDHNNQPLAGVPLRGGYNSIQWHSKPTNAQGITIDWTAGNAVTNRMYEARVNVSLDTISKNTAANGGQLFSFKTSLLTLNLQDCHGGGIAGGHVRYGKGSISSHFPNGAGINTDAAGQTSAELFTGTYVLEMGISQGTETKTFTFTGNNQCTWNTTNVFTNYLGAVSYSNGSNPAGNTAWFTKTGTPMLAGNYYFKFNGAIPLVLPVTVLAGCDQEVSNLPLQAKTSPTGVSDVLGGTKMSFYPNPAQNRLTVTIPVNADIMVVSMDGRVLLKQAGQAGVNDLDVSALPAGTYSITAGGQAGKLIKQ